MVKSFNFSIAPGHLIRRAHQFAVAIFMDETAAFDVTPVQFAILNALMDDPGEDQITLSGRVAFDPATSGSVIGRLEAKGWVRREADPSDRRRKLLWATAEGARVALQMKRGVTAAQQRIVGPLSQAEAQQLTYLLEKLVRGHEQQPQVPPLPQEPQEPQKPQKRQDPPTRLTG
jgi:DNA-binding MarR family transcriptional regulator